MSDENTDRNALADYEALSRVIAMIDLQLREARRVAHKNPNVRWVCNRTWRLWKFRSELIKMRRYIFGTRHQFTHGSQK